MKKMLSITAVMLLSAAVFSQFTPMDYLNAIPKPPGNPCGFDIGEKTQFLEELESILRPYKENAEKESEDSEEFREEHEADQAVSALMKMGYTREEAEKLKNADQMSEEEQMAIANQMMKRQNNMSIKQAMKVSEYDSAAAGRWANARATMMQAEVQADPEKGTKKQLEIKDRLGLQQEIKWLQDKLTGGENKYLEMLRQLDAEADTAKAKMTPSIDRLYKDLTEGNGDSDQIINKIQSLRQSYCAKFTSKYLEIIEGYKGYVVEHLQDYNRLEELQMKLAESQGILDDPNYTPGKLAMGKAGGYANMVGGIFKYNLNADVGAQFVGY